MAFHSRMPARLSILPLAALLLCSGAGAAEAQLLSPGKLSAPHASLEGMSSCTSCHELGKRSTPDGKCLACHGALAARVQRKTGLHAGFTGKACTACHKEHFGLKFEMLRFDTAGFQHADAGYQLREAHLKTGCRDCHQAKFVADTAVRRYAGEHQTLARTWLGLPRGCVACHREDDVHGTQFAARTCNECHSEKTWKDAPAFDHGRTRYALTGKHQQVRCSACHKAALMAGAARPLVQFASVAYSSCTDCHRDPHRGTMRGTCESCHRTDGWDRLANRSQFETTFDHNRTRFALKGAHARATCSKCHDPALVPGWTVRLVFAAQPSPRSYPTPRATDCQACHVDVHQSAFARSPGGPACQGCHNETSWIPAAYDFARHSRETYPLTGAHLAVPCAGCHPTAPRARVPRFHLGGRECVSCHAQEDPHQDQFAGRACSECHGTPSFRVGVEFNHAKTRYPLDGAHAKVACNACHLKVAGPRGSFVRYRPLGTSCRSCHATTPGKAS